MAHKVMGEHIIDDMVLPGHVTQETVNKVGAFDFRKDDLLIVTYPRCGSTWIQEIAWLVANNNDTSASKSIPILQRSRYMECVWMDGTPSTDLLQSDPSPRVMKTYLPAKYLQQQFTKDQPVKTIVCLRNVKDLVVSMYHFYRMNAALGNFKGSFKEFFQMFKEKKLIYGDYFDHTIGWWDMKDNPNVLIMYYEDLVKDLEKEVKKIAQFMGKDIDDEGIRKIVKECTFESMKTNPMTNGEDLPMFDSSISEFLRKGEVGDWKNYFTDEENLYVDKLIKDRLEADELKMTYEL